MESPETHETEDHQTRADHQKSCLGVRPGSPEYGDQDQTDHNELENDASVRCGKQ